MPFWINLVEEWSEQEMGRDMWLACSEDPLTLRFRMGGPYLSDLLRSCCDFPDPYSGLFDHCKGNLLCGVPIMFANFRFFLITLICSDLFCGRYCPGPLRFGQNDA